MNHHYGYNRHLREGVPDRAPNVALASERFDSEDAMRVIGLAGRAFRADGARVVPPRLCC